MSYATEWAAFQAKYPNETNTQNNTLQNGAINPLKNSQFATQTGASMMNVDASKYTMVDGKAVPVDGAALGLGERGAIDDYNSQFDTPYMDYMNMGVGAANTIMGAIGSYDNYQTNKLKRKGLSQDIEFSAQARADKTAHD